MAEVDSVFPLQLGQLSLHAPIIAIEAKLQKFFYLRPVQHMMKVQRCSSLSLPPKEDIGKI